MKARRHYDHRIDRSGHIEPIMPNPFGKKHATFSGGAHYTCRSCGLRSYPRANALVVVMLKVQALLGELAQVSPSIGEFGNACLGLSKLSPSPYTRLELSTLTNEERRRREG
eukprot:6640927-Pyramimonas_sp.AAC.1